MKTTDEVTTRADKRIQELESWLKGNPDHPDRILVEKDLRTLKKKTDERTSND